MRGVWDRHLCRNKNTKRDGSETIPQSALLMKGFVPFHNIKGPKASLLFAIKRHQLTDVRV